MFLPIFPQGCPRQSWAVIWRWGWMTSWSVRLTQSPEKFPFASSTSLIKWWRWSLAWSPGIWSRNDCLVVISKSNYQCILLVTLKQWSLASFILSWQMICWLVHLFLNFNLSRLQVCGQRRDVRVFSIQNKSPFCIWGYWWSRCLLLWYACSGVWIRLPSAKPEVRTLPHYFTYLHSISYLFSANILIFSLCSFPQTSLHLLPGQRALFPASLSKNSSLPWNSNRVLGICQEIRVSTGFYKSVNWIQIKS